MKCAVLVRESKLDGGQSGTVDTQRDYLVDWCAQHGHVVTDIYVDDGVSGMLELSDRPEGARLLRDANRGLFDAVVMSRVDRAGRHQSVIWNFIGDLEALGVPAIFAMQPMVTDTPAGQAQLGMFAVFAQLERALVIERMHEGRQHTARNAGWAGGPPPLGFSVLRHGNFPVLQVDREPAAGLSFSEAELIARVFHDFLERYPSIQALVDVLDNEGVPPPRQINYPRHGRGPGRDDRWADATIHRILTHPIYKGLLRWGQRRDGGATYEVEAPHLAIVSEETWDAAQRKLRENSKRSTRNPKVSYLLGSGLLRCASCGYSFAGRNYGEGRGGRVYICTGRYQHRALRIDPCSAPILKADEYEALIWKHVCEFADHPQEALDRLAAQLADQPKGLQEQADKLTSSLNALQDARRRSERLFVRGTWSEERLDEELASLSKEGTALRAQLEEIRARLDDAEGVRRCLSDAERLLADLRGRISEGVSTAEQRRIIADAVRWVRVEPRETDWVLRVSFVFGDVPQAAFIRSKATSTHG
jgi:site-specific DNA recombinase